METVITAPGTKRMIILSKVKTLEDWKLDSLDGEIQEMQSHYRVQNLL